MMVHCMPQTGKYAARVTPPGEPAEISDFGLRGKKQNKISTHPYRERVNFTLCITHFA